MKRLLVLSTIIFLALSGHAQTGMPKELTCTETAFNFSFSLGSGWKLGAPKMGPVEILDHDVDYNPLWHLKVKDVMVQTNLSPFLPGPFAVQKHEGLSLLREPQFLFPKPNFEALPNYTTYWFNSSRRGDLNLTR